MNNYFRQYVAKLCTTRKYHTLQTDQFGLSILRVALSLHHPYSNGVSCDICDEVRAPHLDLDSFDHLVDDSLGSLIPSR